MTQWRHLAWCAIAFASCIAACNGSSPADAGDSTAVDVVDVRDAPLDSTDTTDTADVASDSSDAADVALQVAPVHSASLVVSADGQRVYVVNADTDSISVVDVAAARLQREIALGTTPPSIDPVTQRYDPSIMPRALALDEARGLAFVTGERSGDLMVVDLASGTVSTRVPVGSEPIGVVVTPDASSAFVAVSQDARVVRVDLATHMVSATVATADKPWALALSPDGSTLFVSHLLAPTITTIDTASFSLRTAWTLPRTPRQSDPTVANGEIRGLYDLAIRPGSNELWAAHLLLATQTPQAPPGSTEGQLTFDSTVFPALSVLDATAGSLVARLTTASTNGHGTDGQFGDVVSGPHAIAFMPDGRFALVADTNSADVLVVDARSRFESSLIRPLPGAMIEGIAISPDGRHAYVDERNTGDLAVLDIDPTVDPIAVAKHTTTDGSDLAIPRLASDPMGSYRTGQRTFYSADIRTGLTQNFWVACASCHIEGRSDAVVWQFTPGPRDTPSNAGGVANTGFLFHTADRARVQDYWHTIQIEQGGNITASETSVLDPLAAYVNFAISYPVPPQTDPAAVARGNVIFHRGDVGCSGCHAGAYFTDSGSGNPTLDLGGTVLLHDVGTCDTGTYPDVAHTDDLGHPRAACMFDTPSLRGIADSAPYFHDGSAATLRDALIQTRGHMGDITSLTSGDLDDLVAYLRSL